MHWKVLYDYNMNHPVRGITFTECLFENKLGRIPAYKVQEVVGSYNFTYIRDIKGGKCTINDDLGLLGFNSLDLSKDFCYITEGVSDFFAVKFLSKENVLGRTKLSVSGTPVKILLNLFDNYCLVGDPDKSGFKALNEWRQFLIKNGKVVTITIPPGNDDAAKYFNREINLKWQLQQHIDPQDLQMW